MFRVRIIATPKQLEGLASRGPEIIDRLMVKMNLLMFKLQAKIVENLPHFFKTSPNIASTVRAIPATIEGTKIIGQVQAGGPRTTTETLGGPNAGVRVDYAAVQEHGVGHSWLIQPVLYSNAWAISQKSRVLSVNGLPRALAFLMNGKLIIVRSIQHPALAERPFMRSGLLLMQDEIVNELNAEFTKILGG